MKVTTTYTRLAILCSTLITGVGAAHGDIQCPGSPALKNAKCSMYITFSDPCTDVQTEITHRLQSEDSWSDPHNGGTYTMDATAHVHAMDRDTRTTLRGNHLTGYGHYTDKFIFTFTDASDGGCEVTACSESQVFSILDYSTNFCNLRNLYCNASDGCQVVSKDLGPYEETYADCWQNKKENCIHEKETLDNK